MATRLRLYVNRCGTLHTHAPAEELDLASVPALQPGQSGEADAELLEVRLESRLSSTQREMFWRRSKRRAINILLPLGGIKKLLYPDLDPERAGFDLDFDLEWEAAGKLLAGAKSTPGALKRKPFSTTYRHD